jgi:hypothetical protein
VEKIQDYRHAETEIGDIMLEVQVFFLKIETQLDHLRQIWDQLSESHQVLQNRLIQELNTRLVGAIMKFSELNGGESRTGKLKFALSGKAYLTKTMVELNKWYSHFDPSYLLIGCMSKIVIDSKVISPDAGSDVDGLWSRTKQLDVNTAPLSYGDDRVQPLRRTTTRTTSTDKTEIKSIFIDGTDVSMETLSIAHSSSRLGTLQKSGRKVILDTVSAGPRDQAAGVTKGVRELARILGTVDPHRLGLLSCCGVIKILKFDTGSPTESRSQERVARFDFVFEIPETLATPPRSLRDIMLAQDPRTPLNELVNITKLLARSVFFIHTRHFVHKNIRPENVLVFRDQKGDTGRPYLIGFERFRADGALSMMFGDGYWERDLYRHRSRQGLQPEKYFSMQHDIYSLGVVMLEIGLKTSFVTPAKHDTSPTRTPPTLGPLLNLSDTLLNDKNPQTRAKTLERQLVMLAKEQLPVSMGWLYSEVVLSCLTCLDQDNERFGDRSEFQDEDGIEVGVRYIDKVRESLPILLNQIAKISDTCSIG